MELQEVLIASSSPENPQKPPEPSRNLEMEQLDLINHYHKHFGSHVFNIANILRIDLRKPGAKRNINVLVTGILFIFAAYSICFNIKITFSTRHLSAELAAQLLIILWAVQSLISMVFLIYWQIYGHLSEFRVKLSQCQNLKGLACEDGQKYIEVTTRAFFSAIFLTCSVTAALATKYQLEEKHTVFQEKQSYIFFYPALRPFYTLITTYLYIVFNMTLFILIHYTNATMLEMRYFNREISNFNGSGDGASAKLIEHLEIYSNLCTVIRHLDLIFRLYTFIMIVITIPSMIFTLMMMNHRIHSFYDLILCMPTIGLCAFSFFAVTIAPARLHDEICRSKGYLCQNRSIWFPYRKEVYLIANTLSSHMEQFDLGVSVWGFALLSRPLILGTLSATAMMLSLLTELAPKAELLNEV
ncbi:G protein-coupled receptor [Caenorhabditis elegans]|uniref:G protein-coupled receptor n=1 Tax=Caenorhabditis elegans TaxID=6239 RepID=Q9XU57_CAEEL|nr:G protein-coupled receptor [Caenorhabditis elegans]CAB05770.3 G protein-coupled receptor [Caenorhabditis elegans]|eukprot:NP_496947.3 GUstatory Receptor family [Caenorhabditis elegans]